MFNSGMPSLADIAAVTKNDNGGFGDGNGWWVLIILFALFGGWGNNAGVYGGGGVQDGYILASDFSNIERKIDGVNNGLCDGFYAMNTGMLNGFGAVNTGILQLGNAVQAGDTAIQSQIAQCCCDNKAAIADLKYTMATMENNIMLNCNNNYRQLHDEMVAAQMATKDETIEQLRAKVAALDLAASQQAQNNYIVNQLRPAAVPAYVVQNPYNGYGYQCNCNNGFNGCSGF